MGFASAFKKFVDVTTEVAPFVLPRLGLPPQAASAIVTGLQVSTLMAGASNEEKAAKAAVVAQASLKATNALRVQHGLPPLVDEDTSADALAQALKMTYDISKMVHLASGDAMPVAA